MVQSTVTVLDCRVGQSGHRSLSPFIYRFRRKFFHREGWCIGAAARCITLSVRFNLDRTNPIRGERREESKPPVRKGILGGITRVRALGWCFFFEFFSFFYYSFLFSLLFLFSFLIFTALFPLPFFFILVLFPTTLGMLRARITHSLVTDPILHRNRALVNDQQVVLTQIRCIFGQLRIQEEKNPYPTA